MRPKNEHPARGAASKKTNVLRFPLPGRRNARHRAAVRTAEDRAELVDRGIWQAPYKTGCVSILYAVTSSGHRLAEVAVESTEYADAAVEMLCDFLNRVDPVDLKVCR